MRMNIGKNGKLYGTNNGYLGQSRNLRNGWILNTYVTSNNSKKAIVDFTMMMVYLFCVM